MQTAARSLWRFGRIELRRAGSLSSGGACAHDLTDGFKAEAVIADKGYDSDHLIDEIVQARAQAVIPPKRNHKVQRSYDADLYKDRNLIERYGLAQWIEPSETRA